MQRARSSGSISSLDNRGRVALALVAVVLIALALFLYFRAPAVTPAPVAAVEPAPVAQRSEPVAALEPAPSAVLPSRASAAVEIPAEERLELHVATRVALVPTSQAVPRIHVEVGYGTSFDESSDILGTGTTDDAGNATIAVPKRALGEVAINGGARYWARVVEPGYQRRTGGSSRAPGSDATRITVIAYAGNTITGRVVDEAGQPVKAGVSSRYWHANGKLVRDAGGDTDANGTFVLHCNKATRVTVVASAGNRGTGVLADVELPRAAGCEPLTVVVHGPGIVRGRVSDASGTPAAGLDLAVLVAELDDPNGSFVSPEPRGTAIEVEGRGQSWQTLTTGADGSFESKGLRDDRYVVRARTSDSSGYPLLLTNAPVAADGASLELRLRRPHLLVRVVDETGAPWPKTLDCDAVWSRREDENVGDKARVVVSAARDAAQAFELGDYIVSGRFIGDSSYTFDVAPGREYSVCLIGGDLGFSSKKVVIPETAGRIECVLVGAKMRPLGTIDVEPKMPDGSDVRGGLVLRVEEPNSGFPIIDKQVNYVDGKRVALPVAEGTYTLVVEGSAVIESYHGTRISARTAGRTEMTVTVRSGETTHVEPVLGAGARIHVRLEGKPNDDDRGALEKQHPGTTWGGPMEWATLVEFQLTAQNRWPTPVYFRFDLGSTSAAGVHEWSRMELGTEATSELLPSGAYTLQARLPGGRIVNTPVALFDGATADVTVRFR